MCVGVCLTRRGRVYFGASVHILVTFILFLGSSIRAIKMTTFERENTRKELMGSFLIALYFFILLILGCLIFRATEMRHARLLGWSGGIFIILETFAFLLNLMVLSPMGSLTDEYGLRNFGFSMNFLYLLLSIFFLLCMMGYCATIIMFISQMKEEGTDTSSEPPEDEEGEGGSLSSSRQGLSLTTAKKAVTSFFRRSHSQPQMHMNNKGHGGMGMGMGPGGPGGGGFNILEVVKEAKRQQQLKELKEQQELKRAQEKDARERKMRSQSQHAPNKSSRPHTPKGQLQSTRDIGSGPRSGTATCTGTEESLTLSSVDQGTQISEGPRPPSRHSTGSTRRTMEQQTQTPPQIPIYPPHPHLPNLVSHPPLRPPLRLPPPSLQSQTLPHRRSQLQQMHNQPSFSFDDSLGPGGGPVRPYFGILSAPSFSFSSMNTASIVPQRFRNPNPSGPLRTTKSGTLGGRYSPPPPPIPRGGGGIPLPPRVTRTLTTSSSLSSFDPFMGNNPNARDRDSESYDEWPDPPVPLLPLRRDPPHPHPHPLPPPVPMRPLRGNNIFGYNALRRGTHRSDYGVEV